MTKIAFTGDLGFTRYFKDACTREDLFSQEIVDYLSSTDYTVVNVEGCISTGKGTANQPILHANSPECIYWLKKFNGNIWNLANNHIMDSGVEGMQSTLDFAKENNVLTVGIGNNMVEAQKPIILKNESGGIGIIAVTYDDVEQATDTTAGCVRWENRLKVKELIEEVKKECRWCVVVAHTGMEFCQVPPPYIRNAYREYLEFGADIVVGHHPHVVENYETVGDKIIFYSLGNFIFDTDYQRLQRHTQYGMLVKIDFNEDSYTWDYLPVFIDRENGKIGKGECSVIFTDIDPKNYKLLWPLSANDVYQNERVKFAYLYDKNKTFNKFQWMLWEIKRCRVKRGRDVIRGRILYYLGLWKKADKKLVEYIKHK